MPELPTDAATCRASFTLAHVSPVCTLLEPSSRAGALLWSAQDLTGGNVLLVANEKDRRGFIAKVGAAVALHLEGKGSTCPAVT